VMRPHLVFIRSHSAGTNAGWELRCCFAFLRFAMKKLRSGMTGFGEF